MERIALAEALARAAGLDLIVTEGTPMVRGPCVLEAEPHGFAEAFLAAVSGNAEVLVAAPEWGETERAQLAALVRQAPETTGEAGAHGWLALPTGGSSGQLKFARHDQDTLAAAVRGFEAHFEVHPINAIGVLPMHHVSGLVAWMRCAMSGGRYEYVGWEALKAGHFPALGAGAWFISLVPTQLQRLLAIPAAVAWLTGFRAVLVGGGPAWPELLATAATRGVPAVLSYGMTETAAMVTAQLPGDLSAGDRTSGRALPHAKVTTDADGRIAVAGESVFRGYWPLWRESSGPWVTDDLGGLDEMGRLNVWGRWDALIITGGKKVDPGEVETAIRTLDWWEDLAVVGLPDPAWGEQVVLAVPADGAGAGRSDRELREALEGKLAAYKLPRAVRIVQPWIRSTTGKVNRVALRAWLLAHP